MVLQNKACVVAKSRQSMYVSPVIVVISCSEGALLSLHSVVWLIHTGVHSIALSVTQLANDNIHIQLHSLLSTYI